MHNCDRSTLSLKVCTCTLIVIYLQSKFCEYPKVLSVTSVTQIPETENILRN